MRSTLRRISAFLGEFRIVENSRNRLIVVELPHYLGGAVAAGLGLWIIGLWANSHVRHDPIGTAVVALPAFIVFFISARGCTKTKLSASRGGDSLHVQRGLFGLKLQKQYPFRDIARIFEWRASKGNGLVMELRSGKRVNLFFQLYNDEDDVGDVVSALKQYLDNQSTPPRRPS